MKIIILIFALCLITPIIAVNESGKEYKHYECEYFKVGDKVTYSYYWVYLNKTDFVGVVIKIEPKPTNEDMHWITIKKISGTGESGKYSEQFLNKLNTIAYKPFG